MNRSGGSGMPIVLLRGCRSKILVSLAVLLITNASNVTILSCQSFFYVRFLPYLESDLLARAPFVNGGW